MAQLNNKGEEWNCSGILEAYVTMKFSRLHATFYVYIGGRVPQDFKYAGRVKPF